MAKLVVFYSRADENYFGGQHRYIKVGNTEKAANEIELMALDALHSKVEELSSSEKSDDGNAEEENPENKK